MTGKKALIVGVASERSIAAGIAEVFAREGCEIAFTYQNEKLQNRVGKLSERLGQNTDLLFPCDVTSDDEIGAVFENLGKSWDGLDIIEKVIRKSKLILKNNGLIAIEIGLGQHYNVAKLLEKNGFYIFKTIKDYQKIKRCILAKKINEKF